MLKLKTICLYVIRLVQILSSACSAFHMDFKFKEIPRTASATPNPDYHPVVFATIFSVCHIKPCHDGILRLLAAAVPPEVFTYMPLTPRLYIFQGHPAVATAGNDDEDENVDVEGDAETTMYDIMYGGGSSGWHGQQPLNRMRQQQMLMHSGGYNRGETRSVFVHYRFFYNY